MTLTEAILEFLNALPENHRLVTADDLDRRLAECFPGERDEVAITQAFAEIVQTQGLAVGIFEYGDMLDCGVGLKAKIRRRPEGTLMFVDGEYPREDWA